MTRPSIVAHRGASGHQHENTLPAFLLAERLGADAVELDVHATLDGVLLVHHDADVEGLGAIQEHSHQHFAAHRLPNGSAIPVLEEVLAALGNVGVWIEVKSLDPRWDGELLRVIGSGPAPGNYGVHGFDHRIVARLGAAAPRLRRGILQCSYPVDLLAPLVAAGASVLWQEAELIDSEMVEAMHAAGKQVIAWTVNDPREMDRLLGLSVDGICGNYPERIRAAIGAGA
jgi:glycerophosphoryl diester phosphodiesterase